MKIKKSWIAVFFLVMLSGLAIASTTTTIRDTVSTFEDVNGSRANFTYYCNRTNCYTVSDFLVDTGSSYVQGANISIAGNTISVATGLYTDLKNTFDALYASISVVKTWIDTNSTADRAYTDVRVNSMANVSKSYVDTSISTNSTFDRAYTDTRVNSMANVSKSYVDTSISANITSANTSMKSYVDAQDTLVRSSVVNNATATNTSMKSYVDTNYLNLTGGRLTGPLNMSNNNIYYINRTCYDVTCSVYTTWNGSCLISRTSTTEIKQGNAC